MNEKEIHFQGVGQKIEGAMQSKLFGKECFKINGKAFVCFFKDEMVFKLSGKAHRNALSLDGASLFDPSGKGRPMKEWVQLPYDYKSKWEDFAEQSADYVRGL